MPQPLSPRVGLVVLAAVAGCTPLGAWLYDDPTFVLSAVSRRGGGIQRDTLEMVLVACNRNEFTLTGSAIEVSVQVDGRTVSQGRSERSFVLPLRDSTAVTVPIAIAREQLRGIGAAGAQPVRFRLLGRGVVRTPLGVRRVPFGFSGALRFPEGAESTAVERSGPPCRPGRSTIPPGGPWVPDEQLPAPPSTPPAKGQFSPPILIVRPRPIVTR